MTKEFEDGEVKQEARDALATAFEGVGGMSKFIAWAKTHRSAFYSMYVKLLPMQVQSKVDVTHRDSDEALHKLQDAFQRAFASRCEDEAREEAAGIFRDDEGVLIERGTEQYRLLQARYELDQKIDAARGGGRAIDDAGRAPLVGVTYTRDDAPSTVDARPATPVNDPPTRADADSNSKSNLENNGPPLRRGPSAEQKAPAPNSTTLFYEYYNGGGGRKFWGGIGEGGGPP
jgi:hypothetical protein